MTTDAKSLSEHLGERIKTARTARGWRQDEVAAEARRLGLAWTRATVAAIETGKREVTAGELLLLPHLLRYEVELPDLFPDDCRVRLGLGSVATGAAVRLALAGTAGEIAPLPGDLEPLRPMAEELHTAGEKVASMLRELHDYQEGMEAVWPGAKGGWVAAERDADQEVERRAATRLGVDPRHLALAARRCWGRSLTEERDARTPAGVTSAGHITRALVEELRPLLEAGGLVEKED